MITNLLDYHKVNISDGDLIKVTTNNKSIIYNLKLNGILPTLCSEKYGKINLLSFYNYDDIIHSSKIKTKSKVEVIKNNVSFLEWYTNLKELAISKNVKCFTTWYPYDNYPREEFELGLRPIDVMRDIERYE